MSPAPVKVAGCIVTYRSPAPEVKAAAQSFLAANLTKDLVIIDNASGDDYLTQLRRAIPIVIIDTGENRGFGFGHNLGYTQVAASDYFLVLNPDVVLHEGALEAMTAFMDANPQVGALTPKVLNPDGSLQPLNKRLPTVFDLFARRFIPGRLQRWKPIRRRMERYAMLDVGYEKQVEVPFISGCCMLLRRSVIEQVGLFDNRFFMYLEDADLSRRIAEVAKVVYYPEAIITHQWKRGSHHSVRLFCVMLHSMWVYFTKWGWKWA